MCNIAAGQGAGCNGRPNRNCEANVSAIEGRNWPRFRGLRILCFAPGRVLSSLLNNCPGRKQNPRAGGAANGVRWPQPEPRSSHLRCCKPTPNQWTRPPYRGNPIQNAQDGALVTGHARCLPGYVAGLSSLGRWRVFA